MKNYSSEVYYRDVDKSIPTRGLPTSVFDMYRANRLFKLEDKPVNQGFLSYNVFNDISVFENEIKSIDDILKFETVLRFILLKKDVFVYEPSVRFSSDKLGFKHDSYIRIEEYSLDSSTEIFQKINAFNQLLPIEKLTIENGKVTKSTNPKSLYIDKEDTQVSKLLINDTLALDFLKSFPQNHSIPFIDNSLNLKGNSYKKIYLNFLKSIDKIFQEFTEFTINYGYEIQLPFFTNTVLSIAKNRDDIPNAILQLRSDFEPIRDKLFSYEYKLTSISSPREMALIQKDINSVIENYTSKIFDSGNRVSDFIRLGISLLTNPNESIAKIFNSHYSWNNDFPILFQNSNHRKMKDFISKDNINTNIQHFLTPQEIKHLQLK